MKGKRIFTDAHFSRLTALGLTVEHDFYCSLNVAGTTIYVDLSATVEECWQSAVITAVATEFRKIGRNEVRKNLKTLLETEE